MKTLVIILSMMLLSGCSMFSSKSVPVTMNFPQAPEPLLMEPEKLETLPEDANKVSDILENSTVNYGRFRELQLKFNQWHHWYNTNRKLHKETTE